MLFICSYRGEKLNFFSGQSTQKRPHMEKSSSAVKISTVYDDPAVTDPSDRLLRRNEPTHIKHRVKHFKVSSSNWFNDSNNILIRLLMVEHIKRDWLTARYAYSRKTSFQFFSKYFFSGNDAC